MDFWRVLLITAACGAAVGCLLWFGLDTIASHG
jgi:hypothetical protein